MKEKVSADWLALAADACKEAGVKWRHIVPIRTMEEQFEDSSHFYNNTVLRIDNRFILKLYGPRQKAAYHAERAVLKTLAEHAQFSAPRLVASAKPSDTFPYTIMTVIDGEAPDRDWTGYTESERLSLAAELGTITRELHQLPVGILAAVEAKQGGARAEIDRQQAERLKEIEAATHFTPRQRERLRQFALEEGRHFLEQSPVLTHADLSHAHLFVAREGGQPHVTGFVDWGEALIGPATWDIAAHWLWSFTYDRPMMRACLETYYSDGLPERFARRCLATMFYTYSMQLLWPHFFERPFETEDPIREATARLFPPEVFGSPD